MIDDTDDNAVAELPDDGDSRCDSTEVDDGADDDEEEREEEAEEADGISSTC